jgi:hypothetical protein
MGKATLHFLIKVGDLHGAELSDYRIISKSCRLPFRSVTWVVDHVAVIGMGETSEGTRRSAASRGLLGSLGNSQPVVQGWAVPVCGTASLSAPLAMHPLLSMKLGLRFDLAQRPELGEGVPRSGTGEGFAGHFQEAARPRFFHPSWALDSWAL